MKYPGIILQKTAAMREKLQNDPAAQGQAIMLASFGLFALLFYSFLLLAGINPLNLITPGLAFSLPGRDSREIINIHFPQQGLKDAWVPTPVKIDMSLDEESGQRENLRKIFTHLFAQMAQGRELKKPGEEFHPSDDKLLVSLPAISLREVWPRPEGLIIDLHMNKVRQAGETAMLNWLGSFRKTIAGNAGLRSLLKTSSIDFRFNGKPASLVAKRFMWDVADPVTTFVPIKL